MKMGLVRVASHGVDGLRRSMHKNLTRQQHSHLASLRETYCELELPIPLSRLPVLKSHVLPVPSRCSLSSARSILRYLTFCIRLLRLVRSPSTFRTRLLTTGTRGDKESVKGYFFVFFTLVLRFATCWSTRRAGL
jgi:hypothetical protein